MQFLWIRNVLCVVCNIYVEITVRYSHMKYSVWVHQKQRMMEILTEKFYASMVSIS